MFQGIGLSDDSWAIIASIGSESNLISWPMIFGIAPTYIGQPGGPTIGPNPNPTKCQIIDPVLGALEFTGKVGLEAQIGPVKFGESYYDNFVSGDNGAKFEASVGLVSVSANRPTPPGGSVTGNAPPAQWSLSALGFNFNLSNWQYTGWDPSKGFQMGGQLFVGGEFSLNSHTAAYLSKMNAICRSKGGS